MSELKPCPFCGGEANTTETARSGKRWGVACSCGAAIRFFDSEAEATSAWNKRVGMSYEDAAIMLDELGVSERTCRMEYQRGSDNPRRGWWLCDSCDGLTDSVGSGWNGEKQRMNPPLYCSRCGRRVVE